MGTTTHGCHHKLRRGRTFSIRATTRATTRASSTGHAAWAADADVLACLADHGSLTKTATQLPEPAETGRTTQTSAAAVRLLAGSAARRPPPMEATPPPPAYPAVEFRELHQYEDPYCAVVAQVVAVVVAPPNAGIVTVHLTDYTRAAGSRIAALPAPTPTCDVPLAHRGMLMALDCRGLDAARRAADLQPGDFIYAVPCEVVGGPYDVSLAVSLDAAADADVDVADARCFSEPAQRFCRVTRGNCVSVLPSAVVPHFWALVARYETALMMMNPSTERPRYAHGRAPPPSSGAAVAAGAASPGAAPAAAASSQGTSFALTQASAFRWPPASHTEYTSPSVPLRQPSAASDARLSYVPPSGPHGASSHDGPWAPAHGAWRTASRIAAIDDEDPSGTPVPAPSVVAKHDEVTQVQAPPPRRVVEAAPSPMTATVVTAPPARHAIGLEAHDRLQDVEQVYEGGYFDLVVEVHTPPKAYSRFVFLGVFDRTPVHDSALRYPYAHGRDAECVLRLTCWDDAVAPSRELKVGDIVYVQNAMAHYDSRHMFELMCRVNESHPESQLVVLTNDNYTACGPHVAEKYLRLLARREGRDPESVPPASPEQAAAPASPPSPAPISPVLTAPIPAESMPAAPLITAPVPATPIPETPIPAAPISGTPIITAPMPQTPASMAPDGDHATDTSAIARSVAPLSMGSATITQLSHAPPPPSCCHLLGRVTAVEPDLASDTAALTFLDYSLGRSGVATILCHDAAARGFTTPTADHRAVMLITNARAVGVLQFDLPPRGDDTAAHIRRIRNVDDIPDFLAHRGISLTLYKMTRNTALRESVQATIPSAVVAPSSSALVPSPVPSPAPAPVPAPASTPAAAMTMTAPPLTTSEWVATAPSSVPSVPAPAAPSSAPSVPPSSITEASPTDDDVGPPTKQSMKGCRPDVAKPLVKPIKQDTAVSQLISPTPQAVASASAAAAASPAAAAESPIAAKPSAAVIAAAPRPSIAGPRLTRIVGPPLAYTRVKDGLMMALALARNGFGLRDAMGRRPAEPRFALLVRVVQLEPADVMQMAQPRAPRTARRGCRSDDDSDRASESEHSGLSASDSDGLRGTGCAPLAACDGLNGPESTKGRSMTSTAAYAPAKEWAFNLVVREHDRQQGNVISIAVRGRAAAQFLGGVPADDYGAEEPDVKRVCLDVSVSATKAAALDEAARPQDPQRTPLTPSMVSQRLKRLLMGTAIFECGVAVVRCSDSGSGSGTGSDEDAEPMFRLIQTELVLDTL
ncbi:hypothetical protein CXG81DRAFT_18787 [Caulochytrium protostelioides]|uniref:Uncharacterized protein n=1 Tax=Caulochytrium protostelioides TaxID=1555241 RepID=A0A4P9X8W6_9FUNG|nr:hypothetical protein CXG81DRAFT_18787 [Caulochytrium protostelioides]|eukprot:RKP01421.1 hypothetical protein CXG81DRAFT_18787 [Caulochytrium protostelioides]